MVVDQSKLPTELARRSLHWDRVPKGFWPETGTFLRSLGEGCTVHHYYSEISPYYDMLRVGNILGGVQLPLRVFTTLLGLERRRARALAFLNCRWRVFRQIRQETLRQEYHGRREFHSFGFRPDGPREAGNELPVHYYVHVSSQRAGGDRRFVLIKLKFWLGSVKSIAIRVGMRGEVTIKEMEHWPAGTWLGRPPHTADGVRALLGSFKQIAPYNIAWAWPTEALSELAKQDPLR